MAKKALLRYNGHQPCDENIPIKDAWRFDGGLCTRGLGLRVISLVVWAYDWDDGQQPRNRLKNMNPHICTIVSWPRTHKHPLFLSGRGHIQFWISRGIVVNLLYKGEVLGTLYTSGLGAIRIMMYTNNYISWWLDGEDFKKKILLKRIILNPLNLIDKDSLLLGAFYILINNHISFINLNLEVSSFYIHFIIFFWYFIYSLLVRFFSNSFQLGRMLGFAGIGVT